MREKLSKGIILIFIANIINMGFNMITNLILPRYLSVETYAMIKTYQLYITYIGILHLGYNDGIYLDYGGKKIGEIDNNKLAKDLSTLRIFQFLILLLGVGVYIFSENTMYLLVALAIMPQNILSYFQFVFQACGEYRIYGKVLNSVSIGTFIVNSILLFLVKSDNYVLYVSLYVLLNVIICLILEIIFYKINNKILYIFNFSINNLIKYIKSGILLTMGNLSSVLMTTMDRLFVKTLINIIEFAQYSFAVSMENFLNLAISPITVTLYNYFCNNDTKESNKKVRMIIIVFASVIIASAFPVNFIIDTFLDKYNSSKLVVLYLFCSQLVYVVIKGYYVNLYKARKQQRKYFVELIFVLIFGVIMNLMFFSILKNKEAFSIATLFSAIVWLLICVIDTKEITFREMFYIIIEILLFLIIGNICNSIVGLIVYLIFTFIIMIALLPEVTIMIKNFLNDIRRK